MTENLGCLLHIQLEDISRIISSIMHDYYTKTVKTPVKTGVIVSYQSFGDLMRLNPHFHCTVLEGGIDEAGSFHHVLIKNTTKLTEVFRRRVIELFVYRVYSTEGSSQRFSPSNIPDFRSTTSVPIPTSSRKVRVNLSQYIIRNPISLQKIFYARSNGTVMYTTKYNEYWKQKIKMAI